MKTIRLSVEGVELDIDYTHVPFYRGAYEKGGLQLSPDEPEHNEVEDIRIAGTGISLFSMIDCMNGLDVIETELAKYTLDEGNDDE
jgi:hypothetical protein